MTEHMKHDVLAGDLYLFVWRDRKRAKVLYFDGTGMCLVAKPPRKGCSRLCGSERSRRRVSP